MSSVYGGRHARRSSVIAFRAKITIAAIAAVIAFIAMVAWVAAPANAAVAPAPVPSYLTDHLAACQADKASAVTLDEKAWADHCVTLAQRDVATWVRTHPTSSPTSSPTPTATATRTVPPTTVPPTTPPPTTTAPPAAASFLTGPAARVGAAPGTVFKSLTGPLQPNTVYDGYTIGGGTIIVSGVTLRNCQLGEVIFTGNDITVDHCTVHGGISISGGDDFVLTDNDLTGWSDGIHITSDSGPVVTGDVEGNWVHQPGLQVPRDCAAHADGMQILGATNIMIRNNVIDLGPWLSCGSDPGDGPLNGAIQAEVTQGGVDGITIDSNLLNGGGDILRVYQGCTDVHVTGNKFGHDYQFSQGDTTTAGAGFVWSGNTDFYTGAAVARS